MTGISVEQWAVQMEVTLLKEKKDSGVDGTQEIWIYTALTDCGTGGYSSAVGEMGRIDRC